MKITKNFTLDEFTRTNHLELLEDNKKYAQDKLSNIRLTSLALEDVRSVVGVGLVVSSGVRNPKLNKKVGGSGTSDHLEGLAADCIPINLAPIIALTRILENINKLKNVGKIIYEEINGKIWFHIEPRLNEDQELVIYKTVDGENYERIV